jgi:hypothetical protein
MLKGARFGERPFAIYNLQGPSQGLAGHQGRGHYTIGVKRRVPPVATSRKLASPFSGARFVGRPLFIEEPSSSRHGLL